MSDLMTPTHHGPTQLKNHIVKRMHDSKIVKAFEITDLI